MEIEGLFLTIAVGVVTIFGAYIVNAVKGVKTDTRLKESRIVQIGLETAEKTVEIVTKGVVGKLEQVSAKDLREKVKSGLAEREELLALADKAFNEIVKTISPDLLKELNNGIRDIEGYIRNEIETQLGLIKASNGK